jgi:hypothetical protein
MAMVASAAALGDGSILFNGGSTNTSKLQNDTANLLAGQSNITICAWVNAAGFGEGNNGTVIRLDEGGSVLILHHPNSADTLSWYVSYTTQDGQWTFPVTDEVWQPIALTFSTSSTNAPQVRVNFADVDPTPVSNPSGTVPSIEPGYCVGNDNNQGTTWNGRIAHVQVFNRILSTDEQDDCLREPGSVTNGLRLWLPMSHATDISDRSVHGYHGTATDLATGSSGPAVFTHPLGAPAGVVLLTAGILPIEEYVIPRDADGTDHPAGRLRGVGPISVVQGTSDGPTNGSDPVVIVQTEDYGEDTDQWQNESGTYLAVLVPTIADLTIAGLDYDNSNYKSVGIHYNTTPIPSTPSHAPQTPAAVIGTAGNEGVTFNNSTSMARNSGANLLNSAQSVTVCFWVRAANWGEDGFGRIICIGDGEAGTDTAFRVYHHPADNTLRVDKLAGPEMGDAYGQWTFPFGERHWNSVCVRLDFSADNAPTVRVNKRAVTVTPLQNPVGIQNAPTSTYTIGNNSAGSSTWDGQIAHVQVWNTILSDINADAAVDDPGSVTSGLRMYLPMTHATDLNDQTANNFDATGTALATHTGFYDRQIGLGCQASGSRIKGVRHFGIPGPAAVIIRPGGSPGGAVLPFDEAMVEIDDVSIYRSYAGYEIAAVDSHLGSYEAQFLRDWGLKVTADSCKIRGPVHVSGVFSGRPDSQSKAVWFTSTSGGWGGPWYVETSDIGMLIESNGNKFGPLYSKDCYYGNLRIVGNRNSITNFDIEVLDGVTEVYGQEGVLISGKGTQLLDGEFSSVPAGEIAIRIKGSNAGERNVLRGINFVGTDGSSAPLISVEETLIASRIDVIAWCSLNTSTQETVVDLYGGGDDRLGAGNIIFISSQNYSTPVKLDPMGWDKESNLIVANGVRVLGSITDATNASPIVITSAGHELRDGEKVTIAAVQGNTSANNSHYVDVLSADTFALYTNESLTMPRSGNGTYTANTGYFGKRFNSVDVAGDDN